MPFRYWSFVLALVLVSPVRAEDWPGWRGPRLDGHSSEKNLPLKWSPTENVAWKTPIPGIGHSSPIIVGEHVFVTSCTLKEQKRVLLCLNRRDGQIIWQRDVLESPLEPKHKLNSYSSSTPASDGKYVYVAFLRLRPKLADDAPPSQPRIKPSVDISKYVPEMVVAAYDLKGDLAWQKSPGRFYSPHGFSSSPILYKNMIIVNGDQDADAYIVALDKSTGEERWRIPREKRTRSYCAPLIADIGGKTQMMLSGAEHIHSYDPDTGKMLWYIDGPTEQFVASPVIADGLVFLTAGFPTYHNIAIRPDGHGNVTKSHVVWHEKEVPAHKAAYVPSPLGHERCFYMISDKGSLTCFDAKTGKRHYMEKLGNHHSASPVCADGHFYLIDDDGVTHVLKTGTSFQKVSENRLDEECYSSPAIAGGQLYIRTNHHLWCIGKK